MVASQRTAAAGWKVAVIDFRPFGGTCALRGCDPKKMLIGGATAIDHVRRMKGKEKVGSAFVVRATADGQPAAFKTDLVVHSAGRAPALEPLDLEAGGLAHHKGRLKLNEFLQSVSNPAVYAAGDAAQMGPPLTPVSSHDAKVVAANLSNGNEQTPNYLGVPSVAFTIPPIAAVGLSERDARAQGLKFRIQHQKASGWFTARQAAEPTYAFNVMVRYETDRILGAHLVGPHADEIINLVALAIRQGITAEAIKSTMFAYPTGASDIGYRLWPELLTGLRLGDEETLRVRPDFPTKALGESDRRSRDRPQEPRPSPR